MSKKIVHILGASGAGTTTLGKAICEKYQYMHLDIDDYFWLPSCIPFTEKRDILERQDLLNSDIQKSEKCVLTGSLCGWGDVFMHSFSLVVYISAPTDLRIERLHKRELERFGDRILENGDMFANHLEFIEWAKTYDTADVDTRSAKLHEEWLKQIGCPIIKLDGRLSIQSQLNTIHKYL